MAYIVPTGGILEMSFEGRQNGQQVMNVWHYYMQNIGGITDGRAAAQDVIAWVAGASGIKDSYVECLTDDVLLINIYAQWILPIRYRYEVSPDPAFTGSIGGPGLPQNVQTSITLYGEEANRHHIGRKALPGVWPAGVVAGELTNIYKAIIQTFADGLLQEHTGGEGELYQPVIFNRQTPELSAVILDGFVQDTVRVERRRTVRVGA